VFLIEFCTAGQIYLEMRRSISVTSKKYGQTRAMIEFDYKNGDAQKCDEK
jgi:hypothetical protein